MTDTQHTDFQADHRFQHFIAETQYPQSDTELHAMDRQPKNSLQDNPNHSKGYSFETNISQSSEPEMQQVGMIDFIEPEASDLFEDGDNSEVLTTPNTQVRNEIQTEINKLNRALPFRPLKQFRTRTGRPTGQFTQATIKGPFDSDSSSCSEDTIHFPKSPHIIPQNLFPQCASPKKLSATPGLLKPPKYKPNKNWKGTPIPDPFASDHSSPERSFHLDVPHLKKSFLHSPSTKASLPSSSLPNPFSRRFPQIGKGQKVARSTWKGKALMPKSVSECNQYKNAFYKVKLNNALLEGEILAQSLKTEKMKEQVMLKYLNRY